MVLYRLTPTLIFQAENIVTDEMVSLKCPLMLQRIKVPVRGIRCQHRQCFDMEVRFIIQRLGDHVRGGSHADLLNARFAWLGFAAHLSLS